MYEHFFLSIDLTTGKVSSFLIKFKSSAFKQHRGLFVVLWSRSYLFRIERRHWRICTSPLTSDSNLNWSETERTPSFSVYRTFLQRAIYMWEFEPLKLLGPFSLGCLSAGIQNAKKKTRVHKAAIYDRTCKKRFSHRFLAAHIYFTKK